MKHHPEKAAQEAARAAAWEAKQAPLNDDALAALRRTIPADIANSTRVAVCAALRATHERQQQQQREEQRGAAGGAMASLSEEDAEKRVRALAKRVWEKKVRTDVAHTDLIY